MTERGQLFIGRLSRSVRPRDLERVFERYGKMTRCDIKPGRSTMNYAFVDYEDARDAEDAIKGEHGRDLMGGNMVVEWSKGPNYKFRPEPSERRRDRSRSPRRRSRSRERHSKSKTPPRRRRSRSMSSSRSPTPRRDKRSKSDSKGRSRSKSRSRS